MVRPASVAAVGLPVLLAPADAGAEPPPPSTVDVTFEEAIGLAERAPPLARGHEAASRLDRGRAASPVLDQNPQVEVEAGGRLSPDGQRGFEGSLGLSQSLSLEGAAGLREDALAAEAEQVRAEVAAEALDRHLGAASAWLALHVAEERHALAVRDVTTEERLASLVSRLAAAGERTAGEVAVSEVRLADARLRERVSEGEVVEARWRLAGELARPSSAPVGTAGPWPEVDVPPPTERWRLVEEAGRLPAVRAEELLAHVERVRAEEEDAARGARLTVGVTARTEPGDVAIVVGTLAVPVPLFDVAGRERAAREASALRAEGAAADARVRARARVATAVHDVQHAEDVHATLVRQLVPAAERAAARLEQQLAAGEATMLEVLEARRARSDALARLAQAEHDRVWARVRLSTLARAIRGAR